MKNALLGLICITYVLFSCNSNNETKFDEIELSENTQVRFAKEIEKVKIIVQNNNNDCKKLFYDAIIFSMERNYEKALDNLSKFELCSENVGGSFNAAASGLKQIILESEEVKDDYFIIVSLQVLLPMIDSLEMTNLSLFKVDSNNVHTVDVE